ncbi:hypothetical protein FRX31_014430, partial [Thalictrum thalictroides]
MPRGGCNISFWKDCWVSNIPLCQYTENPNLIDNMDITVREMYCCTSMDWKWEKFASSSPDHVVNLIKGMSVSNFINPDEFMWSGSSYGE